MKKFLLLAVMAVLCAFVPSAMAAGPHQNALSWNAVPNTAPTGTTSGVTITGYNVYKANASGVYTKGTPFQTVAATVTNFTDTAVTAGGTRFYVVTALCASCTVTESDFSNEFKAVTPLDAAPKPDAPVLNGTVQ